MDLTKEYREKCPDCGVAVGEPHKDGCDIERCSVCRHQRLGCSCEGHDPAASKWTGYWPGVVECHEKGWLCKPRSKNPWDGYVSATPDDPDATADLNRWVYYAVTGKDPGPSYK